MEMEGPWELSVGSPENKYLFNTKEFNNDFGLDWADYGARMYDASIGRWNAVDLLADNQHNYPLTPYHFVSNNPLSNIDPDGMDWYRNNDTGEYSWYKGSGDREGYTNEGAVHVINGKNGYLVHFQNEMVLAVDKSVGSSDAAVGLATSNSSDFSSHIDVSSLLGKIDRSLNGGYRDGFFYNKNGYATSLANISGGSAPIPGIGKGAKLLKFRGLRQGRLLRSLTHQDLVKAFKGTGFKLSGHAIKRLKDVRTAKLGAKTLNDIKQIFNKGTFFNAKHGLVGKSYRGLEVIYNPVTKVIVTVRPAAKSLR